MATKNMAVLHDVIVIGTSDCSLPVLSKLTRSLPAGLPPAVTVVLQTRSPGSDLIGRIVDGSASLPVSYARERDEIRLGHIYLAPPNRHLIVRLPGLLGLDPGPAVHQFRPAADRLFETAAQVYGSRTIGVILAGCVRDGAAGLAAIKAADGVSVAQRG